MSETEIKEKLKLSKFYLETMIDDKAEKETLEHCGNVVLKDCINAIEEGLNLITKQQKEIENSVSKDKIREKMQEYYEKASPYDCDTADYKQSQEIGGFNALRKLLEE